MKKTKSTQVTGCQTCKKGLSKTQISLMLFGFYILGTSVYGTINLVKSILSLF